MARIPESSLWEEEIELISRSERVAGGLDGPANRPLKSLANRTRYLKDQADTADESIAEKVSAVKTFAEGATLESPREEILFDSYRLVWTGEFPKTVLAGSAPQGTGGIGAGCWAYTSDAVIRQNLSSGEGTKLIVAPGNGGTLHDWINGQLRSLFYYLSPAKIASVIGGTATDITAELQAAMNDSIPVWIPAGKYYITNSITASANSSIVGPGPRLASIDNRSSSHAFIIGAGGYLRGGKLWKGFSITAS
ncbi:hypothetical protein LIN66_18280, partial [Raoultella ornithinolytica]|nr:hypothetical protein [Raoultella ornithinolytica]